MPRSLITLLLLASAAPVWAQGSSKAKPTLTVQVEAGRAEAVTGKERTLVVYQATSKKDLTVRGERTAWTKGRLTRQTFSILAERVVAFLPPRDGIGRAALPIQALYAQGFVRLEVSDSSRGGTVIEASEVFLDFARERAFLRSAAIRFGGRGGSGLAGAAFVVRAERLRLLGTAKIVGEGAAVTVCTHGKPHFAVTCERLEMEAEPPPPEPPLPSGFGALGGTAGAVFAEKLRRPNLFAGLLRRKKAPASRGSDALRAEGERPRLVDASGVAITVLPPWRSVEEPYRLPLLPFMTWGTNWPVPSVRVGSSSQFGTTVQVRLKRRLFRKRGALGEIDVKASGGVDYFSDRGTAGDLSVGWKTRTPSGRGEGYLRGYGLRDRGDEDRVGTPIRNEGRFWLRGLFRQALPGGLQADAEVSRISDRGFLLEYFRRVQQTEKEQESYLNVRGSWDDLGARVIGRWRINDFQTQVERLPELRVDWVETPVVTHEDLGGIYFDAAVRAGHLRFRPDSSSTQESYDATRADARFGLSYANRLGPLQLHGWAGARETGWSGSAADEEDAIDRFAADAGWSLTTTLWKRFNTPFGIFRHDIVPEIGTRHVFAVTREPEALLNFDPDVEPLRPTDRIVLRLRTRLWTDAKRRPRKLADLIISSEYQLSTQGTDTGRAWAPIQYDLRLNVLTWVSLRARVAHDVNRNSLVDLNVSTSVIPTPGLRLGVDYRELNGPTRSKALGWSASWRITRAWEVALDQQYDFQTEEFIRHRGRLIRFFHRFALELTVSSNPQQDDIAVSFSVSPVFSDQDPFADDPYRELYRP